MLAETIDAGLLRTAAERKNDERLLVQVRGQDCVALLVCYHKVCYCNYTKYVTRETKVRINQSLKDQFQCTRSPMMFSVRKYVIETEVIGDKKIMYMKDILENFVIIAKAIENVGASNYRALNSSDD